MLMHRQQPTHIQRCGKLVLEYYCDAWATIESQKCDFHRLPSQQKMYRSCSRAALIDQLQYADAADIGVPVRTVLPSSYVGGPRYYHRLFQNAMALPRRFGRPDLFITMTCNPAWSEITLALPAGLSSNFIVCTSNSVWLRFIVGRASRHCSARFHDQGCQFI